MKENEWCKLPQKELERKLEQISDKMGLLCYKKEDVVEVCKKLLMLNLKSYNYDTQEQILYTLCNALAFYDVRDQLELHMLMDYKKDVALGLEEYIDEIVGK